MKKITALFLLAVLAITSLVSCAGRARDKAGIGIYTDFTSDGSAVGASDGHTLYTHTIAAVAIDKDGKITACDIDVAEVRVGFTSDGRTKLAAEYKTKGQLGDDYGMKKAGAKLEWYEQRDSFCKAVIGKTIREVKESVAENGKGSADIISAGCTIAVDEFVRAIVDAEKNAGAISEAPSKIKLKISTDVKGKDASDAALGSIDAETSVVAELDVGAKLEKSTDFSVWFSKTGILQPEPEKNAL